MKKKNAKPLVEEGKNPELFEALGMIEKEKGIPVDVMIEQIKRAILNACKNTYGNSDDVLIKMDPATNEFEVVLYKTVVEEVNDFNKEIHIDEARKKDAGVLVGDRFGIKLDPKNFGRIAVQTSRNIIRQGIRDGEKDRAIAEFQGKLREVVTATVERVDSRSGSITMKFGNAAAELTRNEQVPGETLIEGDSVKVYVAEIRSDKGGPRAIISRSHPDLVKRLFESEVPEIFDGTVEVKSISREAGSRTKIAVFSKDENVDAVGSCIGQRGQRVSTIVAELGGEKIDIIEYNEDPVKFITAALSPAEVLRVEIDENAEKVCRATVPDNQLSLAIGNKGQNVRLAAKLTGWKIDIRPESGFFGEGEEDSKEKVEYIGDGLDDDGEDELSEE